MCYGCFHLGLVQTSTRFATIVYTHFSLKTIAHRRLLRFLIPRCTILPSKHHERDNYVDEIFIMINSTSPSL